MIHIKLNPRSHTAQFNSSPFLYEINSKSYQFNPKSIYFFSTIMKNAVQQCFLEFAKNLQQLQNDNIDYQEISKILCGNPVKITHDNVDVLNCLATTFQIEEITQRIAEFESLQQLIDNEIENDTNIQQLLNIESNLNDLNAENFDQTLQDSLKFIGFSPSQKNKALLNQQQIDLLLDLITGCCIANYHKISLYADLTMELNKCVDISENVKNCIKNKTSKVMIMKTNEIDAFYVYLSKLGFFSKFGEIKNYSCNERIERIVKFKNSSENLTKKGILSSRNNDIVESIRNDDIESLQSILHSLGVFNNEQNHKSNYLDSTIFIHDEVSSIIPNQSHISMINYCAFHQAVKCFEFLRLNKATIDRSFPTFAIAGGNPQIIHEYADSLDKDTNTLFSDSRFYITALHFHHNEIFEWIFQNRTTNDKSHYVNQTDSSISQKCFDYADFTILIFLIKSNYLNLLDVAKVAIYHNNNCIYQLCYNITMKHKETFPNNSVENIVSQFQSLQLKKETKSLIQQSKE